MKIPATIQIVDGDVRIQIATRIFAGEITVAKATNEYGKVPEFGVVEDGERIWLELRRDPKPCPKCKGGGEVNPPGTTDYPIVCPDCSGTGNVRLDA